jgi:hypothetical protein
MPKPDILYTDPVLQIVAHQNLLVIAWSDAPTAYQMRECALVGRALARKHRGGIALLDLILSGKPNFSSEVREEAVKLNRDPTLFRLGIADAVLVSGLTGVAVRAFLSTVGLMARSTVPTRVCASLVDAEEWLLPQLTRGGQSWVSGDLVKLAQPVVSARKRAQAS